MTVGIPRGVLPLGDVRLTDAFWSGWQRQFLDVGLQHQYDQCKSTGRLENFRRVVRGEKSGHEGLYFNDSDVYKWLEAASYGLALDPEWEGKGRVQECIGLIGQAQEADGYIGTSFQIGQMEKRWKALTAKHEMYCIGHLVEAGVAHAESTGDESLLGIGQRAASHVYDTFGPGKRKGYCGHQEFELAACRLSAAIGDSKYRDLAAWMTLTRGSRPSPFESEFSDPVGKELNQGYVPLVFPEGTYNGTYFQDHAPLVDQRQAVGHAVRAMYFYCGAADSCDADDVLLPLRTIWSNLVDRRMYLTGGIGSAGRNEGFTNDFDLPNREAYSETCAAIGLVFWASRMSRLTGDSRYADVMELALYNAVLSGVNAETDKYFYVNPLESRGDHFRQPWFTCACCPPNISRLVLSVQRYAAHNAFGGLTIDLPIAAEYTLAEGTVTVESNWPWEGQVNLRVQSRRSGWKLLLRVPEWCSTAKLPAGTRVEGGYAVVDIGQEGPSEHLFEFPMAVQYAYANPMVPDAIDRVALKRGPLVYCLEECDFGAPVHLFKVDTSLVPVQRGADGRIDLLADGVTTIAEASPLYLSQQTSQARPKTTKLVPYFSWANGDPGSMAVWLRKM